MRAIGLCLCLSTLSLLACESDEPTPSRDTSKPVSTAPTTAPTATATAAPTSEPTAEASAEPTASATASATAVPEAPTTLLGRIAVAERVKLRRPLGGGDEVVVEDPTKVKAIRDAIGTDQEPDDACPRCVPTVQLVFEDVAKTRVGSIGLFCDAGEASEQAVLRDALAESCKSLELADADALEKLVDEVLPMAEEAEEP